MEFRGFKLISGTSFRWRLAAIRLTLLDPPNGVIPTWLNRSSDYHLTDKYAIISPNEICLRRLKRQTVRDTCHIYVPAFLGIWVQGFAEGPDRGRDAKFMGTAELHPARPNLVPVSL